MEHLLAENGLELRNQIKSANEIPFEPSPE